MLVDAHPEMRIAAGDRGDTVGRQARLRIVRPAQALLRRQGQRLRDEHPYRVAGSGLPVAQP